VSFLFGSVGVEVAIGNLYWGTGMITRHKASCLTSRSCALRRNAVGTLCVQWCEAGRRRRASSSPVAHAERGNEKLQSDISMRNIFGVLHHPM
jgi:hypothetical protein